MGPTQESTNDSLILTTARRTGFSDLVITKGRADPSSRKSPFTKLLELAGLMAGMVGRAVMVMVVGGDDRPCWKGPMDGL